MIRGNGRPLGRAQILLLAALLLAVVSFTSPARAAAAVSCPNATPVVNENNCMGAGTQSYVLNKASDNVGGYTTQSSYNKGEDVPLKIGRTGPALPATKVDIAVYRTGYYGGTGARLIPTAGKIGVTINNTFSCNAMDETTGKLDCGNWSVTYTIPGATLPASGVYLAKITTEDTHEDNWITFVLRDDNRVPAARILYVVPTASYQAYNNWGGKSLYYDDGPAAALYGRANGSTTISGADRAVKVSFNRPSYAAEQTRNRYMGPDFDMVQWLEQEGYDVAYTDDYHASIDAAQLKQHKVILIGAHSEYWTGEEMHNVKAARDAGVSVMSVGANTSYWKVRYEDGGRTLVCYKTVEGSDSSGATGANDWGPDGIKGTADDALGADGIAGTADDKPQNATTTFRDNGAPNGDPNAPPGGRVGPDEPENSLWGVMYVGDAEDAMYPLTVPAANASGEFAGDREWRNTGIVTNRSTSIGTDIVGWEWDAVPTQAQYLAQQPAGVHRLTASDPLAGGGTPEYLQDEGRVRSFTPPPGQPSTVNAVRYTAPSGAMVFAAGTNEWAAGLGDPRIEQVTYNVLSDMGVQPTTPVDVTLDPSGSNKPPQAGFTFTPAAPKSNQTITFNASASSDPDGTVTKYEWDWNGDGTYDTTTSSATATHSYPAEGSFDVHLRVTDNGGATDTTVKTVTILDNQPPTAALTANPNPAVASQPITFDASGSHDPDGTIASYKWDFDGNGTYETSSGSSATTTHAFTTPGTVNVGVQVTDNGGKTATATLPVTIARGGLSNYGDAVLNTKGLVDYWRLGESAGPNFADSEGTATGTTTGGVTFGVAGAVAGDPDTAVRFDGVDDAASAAVKLSGTNKLTVEFWLKWSNYANDDRIAMELTDNFNQFGGGFVVDPDAPQGGGTFGVGIGTGSSRNNVFFARPSAGVWHHYAFVLDSSAAAATQITPYVDGQQIAYTKTESGTGAGNFADANLHFMGRAGGQLIGSGDLDEVALYNRALDAGTIADHYGSYGTNRRPVADFTASPNPTRIGKVVTFDASSSHDPDGSIQHYEWDLDGNGTFETDSGTNPVVTHTYSSEGDVDVSVRVTDNQFAIDTQDHNVHIGNEAPTAAFTVTPNPAIVDQSITFDASASSDADGSVVHYEWDLDGNGTYETDTGTTKTVTHSYNTAGTVTVGLRVTDDSGATATTAVPVTIGANGVSDYGDGVLATPGLVDYWRLGESAGPSFADSAGTATGTAGTGVTFGVPGAISGDPNTAARFNGTGTAASAPVDLSHASAVTVEFWLKWNAYNNDDALAMEFTDNFNDNAGGFLVDPNSPQGGGQFGVGMGAGSSRNNAFFARPSAGQWHHYAIVFDSTAPAASQITPYVDGQPVAYTKTESGTGAGNFANAVLHLMSRNDTSLLGAGDLDEVAVYNRALSAGTIADHYANHGTNRRPVASFTVAPNPVKTNTTVTFDGSASHDSDGSIVKYQWDLDGDGHFETDSGTNPVVTKSYASNGDLNVGLRVIDNGGGSDTKTQVLSVGDRAPTAAFTISPTPAVAGHDTTFDASGSSDSDGTIVDYKWDLDGDGTFETDTGATATVHKTYTAAGNPTVGLRVTDDDGVSTTVTHALTIKPGSYDETVMGTSGLLDYWRMDQASGTTLTDSKGSSNATLSGGTLGVPGAVPGGDTATQFNGTSDFASANLNLSGTQTITVEFWLKWQPFVNDDDLALEFTPNFNDNAGGFLVDPDSGNGSFGVGIGQGASRNTVYFDRPSAGVWHHYVFVLDASAPAASQITPYVDGVPVSYFKGDSGTGAGNFANGPLYFMSRGGVNLFGGGELDELAIYNGALSAATVAAHYSAGTP